MPTKWQIENRERCNEIQRKWRAKNRDRVRGYNSASYKKNAEKRRKYARKWSAENLEKRRITSKIWRDANKEKRNSYARQYNKDNPEKFRGYRANIKERVLNAYGRACVCCGESHFEMLTIDHKEGGGTKHRDVVGAYGSGFYQWLIRNNFPAGYQTLCWNCNCSRGLYGFCPHEKERQKVAAD